MEATLLRRWYTTAIRHGNSLIIRFHCCVVVVAVVVAVTTVRTSEIKTRRRGCKKDVGKIEKNVKGHWRELIFNSFASSQILPDIIHRLPLILELMPTNPDVYEAEDKPFNSHRIFLLSIRICST